MGEGLDDVDRAIMPHIDLANIACGGHAGDDESMLRTLKLAKQSGVIAGAHPSYADRENFGRMSQKIPSHDLLSQLVKQVEQLCAIGNENEWPIRYIKPHGALYNDANHSGQVLECLMQLSHQMQLPLMLQALPAHHPIQLERSKLVEKYQVALWYEAFADRAYKANGQLAPRSEKHSVVHNEESVLARCMQLQKHGQLSSDDGTLLALNPETLCVHSDSPNAEHLIRALRRALSEPTP